MKAIAAVFATAGALVGAHAATAGTLPAGFQETTVFSGLTMPTAVRFAPDGRVFVAEKSGIVKVYPSVDSPTPTVFADLRGEVDDYWDRGLLGLALDPSFPTKPYVYVLYTYDAPIGGTAPTWNDACPTPPGPTTDGCVVSGRLARLTAQGNASTSEQVLIEGWCQQFPSHSIGDLHFGPDGSLYLSGGDGASFTFTDYGQTGGSAGSPTPKNPCGDPPVPVGGVQRSPSAEGGALRSQSLRRAAGEPVLLNGSILRVDPSTGAAMVGNPLAGSLDANARRIIAYGMRNPFRFTIRPGTGELWVGDVGANTFEEIDRIPSGSDSVVENFGWPCFEGPLGQPGYQAAKLAMCSALSQPGNVTAPYYYYNHASKAVAGETCPTGSSSITGMTFYTGTSYPTPFSGALVFGDHSRRCIWAMPLGANGQPDPTKVLTFAANAANPVDIQTGPNGDIFYADLEGGTIRRIEYLGANHAPLALARATTATSGPAPLTVSFDGSASRDLDPGDTITYSWDLNGDGVFGDSTAARPTFTYTKPGTYQVRLRVTDRHGASGFSTPVQVAVANSPPTARILAPTSTLTWKVGDTIAFNGTGTDAEDGTLPASKLSWTLIVHHCPSNCHTHTVQSWNGVASGSFVAPDHDYPSYLELQLTAADSTGTSATASVSLQPLTSVLNFSSSPTGLLLAVGPSTSTTPFARTVIVGSDNSISAATPQTLGGTSYAFKSWSDGGAQTHDITAPSGGGSYVATFGTSAGADATPPSVGLSAPAAGSFVRGSVSINASASDNVGVAGVRFFVDGVQLGAEDTSSPYSASWSTTSVAAGLHTLTAIARDAAGNTTTSSGVNVTVDNTAPTVAVTSPTGGATVTGPIAVAADASDGIGVAGVEFTVDGAVVGTEDTTPPYSVTWDPSSLGSGPHSIAAIARDAAGNTTTSAPVAIVTSITAPPPPVRIPGLVAAYGLNEGSGPTIGDSSGSGNPGTAGGTTWVVGGRFGGALSFNGTSSWVTVPDATSLHLAMGMTLEAWVNPSMLGPAWRSVLFKEGASGAVFGLYASGLLPSGRAWVGSAQSVPGTTALPLNTWTHLAVTFDGFSLRLYVNGTLAATRTVRGAIAASTDPLHIGGTSALSAWFSGLIDEVRIYNRALTQTAIAADMTTPVS